MKKVQAKFTCNSVTRRAGYRGAPFHWDYEFSPVTNEFPGDKAFWDATPSGSLKLTSINAELFEVGKAYYLDFTEAVTP